MELISFTGQLRPDTGKTASKSLRREGQIPCVLYSAKESVHFSTTLQQVKNLIYTPDFHVAQLQVGGNTYKCIVKDYQLHPLSNDLVHIDFLQLVDGQPIKVEVPVRVKGQSPGVKVGGKLVQKLRRVKIKTTPEYLVDQLMLDISSLELGQSLRVRDISAENGIEVMSSSGIPVVTIEIPRALRSATAAAEKETGKKK